MIFNPSGEPAPFLYKKWDPIYNQMLSIIFQLSNYGIKEVVLTKDSWLKQKLIKETGVFKSLPAQLYGVRFVGEKNE